MKTILFALVAVATISASAQDTTGCDISADGKLATCLVVVPNEGEGQLETIKFHIRGESAPINSNLGCPVGEAGYASCANGEVPGWLRDLNQAFQDAGFTAPDTSKEDSIGGPQSDLSFTLMHKKGELSFPFLCNLIFQ